jgi:hypothetical protein
LFRGEQETIADGANKLPVRTDGVSPLKITIGEMLWDPNLKLSAEDFGLEKLHNVILSRQ